LLDEVWQRYKLPLAVTEVHIHCDYDDQIRWFSEIRDTCVDLVNNGADIRGICSWAMLGSYGWNRLLTKPGGDYESGAFDVSSGYAVATPIAELIRNLSQNPEYVHPAMAHPGWWKEDARFVFGFTDIEDALERTVPVMKEDYIQR
jgi:dTDP-4-dehydrorhamnose reductase